MPRNGHKAHVFPSKLDARPKARPEKPDPIMSMIKLCALLASVPRINITLAVGAADSDLESRAIMLTESTSVTDVEDRCDGLAVYDNACTSALEALDGPSSHAMNQKAINASSSSTASDTVVTMNTLATVVSANFSAEITNPRRLRASRSLVGTAMSILGPSLMFNSLFGSAEVS
ncbi:hypothetical protein NX059_010271 [Plenodomus lindquistii]|nr:hypothetical protein NX059_010271 [Plenodomus lindquistii]